MIFNVEFKIICTLIMIIQYVLLAFLGIIIISLVLLKANPKSLSNEQTNEYFLAIRHLGKYIWYYELILIFIFI